jgi:hypothetical protein
MQVYVDNSKVQKRIASSAIAVGGAGESSAVSVNGGRDGAKKRGPGGGSGWKPDKRVNITVNMNHSSCGSMQIFHKPNRSSDDDDDDSSSADNSVV